MNNSAFDLDGLTPQRETTPRPARAPVPEYDLTPKAAPAKAPGPADFDLPPVDMRAAWDLQVLLHKEPVPAAPYNAWLRELRALANEAAGRDAEVHDALAPLVDVQATPFATVAFGGHFKTGKSTLLNAALGRRVLPAADLPETGAICVLKSGSVDGVEVFAGGRRRTVPCTLEAIQQEVSLIGEVGERRESVHRVEQLEITLAGCGIPADALWIDSPGINDTDEMNACALRAARRADVLVWVLSSRQPLSEVEMSFLADHIAERGATGVVFVLNAFLPDNTATAWETFLTKKAPWIRDKVLYHAPELGFTEDAPPLIAPVCGLGLYGDSQNDFGRTELRRLLLGLGSPEVPRVRRARLSRVALALRAVAHAQDERRQRERVAYDAMAKAAAEAKRESQRARSDFSGAAGDALERFYGQWAVGARNGATGLAATISGSNLERGDRYGSLLNDTLRNIANGAINALAADARRLSAQFGQPSWGMGDDEALRRLLMPDPVAVRVADLTPADRASQTAALVDDRLRAIIAPLGIHATPTIGANLAAAWAGPRDTTESRERDAEATRQAMIAAADQAIRDLESRREHALRYMRDRDTRFPQGWGPATASDGPDLPSAPPLSYWDERRETVLRLAEQAERLAAQDSGS